jgi:mono/diheme cytochrome c family protein
VLLGITDGGKLGLATAAGLLIIFALLSSFYFPRRNPNFPGNRLGLFIGVTVLLFAVTMAGVWVFAAEEEEPHAAETSETQPTETEPTETEPTETGETTPGTTTEDGGAGEGDAAAGEAVFTSAGCGGCHTMEAADASGAVGPNLDESKPDAALVVDRVTNGAGAMPSFGDELSEQQIQDVAAYVVASTQR